MLKKLRKSASKNKGFALIASLSIMVLLVMITVGMLTLSTSEVRKSSQDKYQLEAQANARMALSIAMTQLQNYAGADQRVTATAEIVDGVTPEKVHWTGVWNTENWDSTAPNQNKEFLSWLVSRNAITPASTDDVKSPHSNSNLITLVGKGSAGDDTDDHVRVEKVEIDTGGSYAYWVGDQGTKAASGLTEQSEQNTWNRTSQLSIIERIGLEATDVPGIETYNSHLPEELRKSALSLNSLDLLQKAEVAKPLFHDVTPLSMSLLTDTRLGGMAKDLSTAFELPLEAFNNIQEFHATSEKNNTNFYESLGAPYSQPKFYPTSASPNLGFITEIRSGDNLFRGPTWDLIRNHYRTYKREWDKPSSWSRAYSPPSDDSFAARGSLPLSYSHASDGANSPQGTFAYHPGAVSLFGKRFDGGWAYYSDIARPRDGFTTSAGPGVQVMLHDQAPRLTPIISRVAMAVGLVKLPDSSETDWKLAISFDPYVTIVNPYNVPISFQSVGMFFTKFTPVDLEFTYTRRSDGQVVTEQKSNPFSQTYYNYGAIAYRLEPPAGDTAWVLKPGEVKVISPSKVGSTPDGHMEWSEPNAVRGDFAYSEGSGLYWNHIHLKPQDGSSIKVKITGEDDTRATLMTASMFYKKGHNGAGRDIVNNLPPKDQYGENDLMDDPYISKISYITKPSANGDALQVDWEGNTGSIPFTSQADASYMAVIDLKMKTARGDTPNFLFNPRGKNFDFRNYDAYDRTDPSWTCTIDPIQDLAELQMVGDPAGHGFWGDGYTAGEGTSNVVLYEVPQLPLTSLAQLQHADIDILGSGNSLQIGNSFAHPGIADTSSVYAKRNNANNFNTKFGMTSLGDLAWASNEMLWDRYFFSGINWGSASLPLNNATQPFNSHTEAVEALIKNDPKAKQPLMNPRIILSGLNAEVPTPEKLKEYDSIAKFLAINGGFNVNSTSKNAWKSVFSTLRDSEIKFNAGGEIKSSKATNAFSRFTIPVAKRADAWNGGFHDLSNDNIDRLAEAMVDQVKERGPFMSMADFVNRRLDSSKGKNGTDVGVLGALQAAIEKAELNDRPEISRPVSAPNIEHKTFSVGGGSSRNLSTYVGTPSYIMQADILSTIGSTLRARSDTFLIRSYGESKDSSGKVQSRAWCEAIVQRSPDWVEDTELTTTVIDPSYGTSSPSGDVITRPWIKNPQFPEANLKFGRKFKLLTFRWLNDDEI